MFKKMGVSCCVLLAAVLAGCGGAKTSMADQPATKQIPVLHWQERSDWINVKTDVTPAAVGDGKADDTAAIQAAFDKIQPGSTVYFPPGTYRVTATLKIIGKKDGVNLIGCGRDTRLVWDGDAGGTMLILDGLPSFLYRGLVLDGAGKAARGISSHNTTAFVTEVLFQDSAFVRFTYFAIFYPPEGSPISDNLDRYAAAETVYQNCLFADSHVGVYSESFNDLNHTFTGCEFDRCITGIYFFHGNFYMRDTHFEGGDLNIWGRQPEHSCTLRRVTSVGAKRFLDFGSSVATLTMQDCHVADWSNPDGAIRMSVWAGLFMDNTFSNANVKGPVVDFSNTQFHRIASNNKVEGLTTSFFSRPPNELIEVPAENVRSNGLTASQSFLRDTAQIPGKVFDAKTDFGAVADGKTDDSAAIQKTIDAARAYGKNAIAYLPSGKYIIGKTLNITGANYYVGGSGYGTELIWKGADGGTLVQVTAPQNITLEDIGIGHADFNRNGGEAADVVQTGSGKPSSIHYKRVLAYGRYMRDSLKGLFFRNLGPGETVLLDEVQGNLHFEDSARATILANVSYEGSVNISGKGKVRDGFLGFMTRLATGVNYGLIDKNNNNAVFSDFYIEQAGSAYNLSGDPDDPPGRVTIQSPKIDFTGKPEQMDAARVFVLDNYAGDIFLGPSQFYVTPKEMRFELKGTRKADLYLLGDSFYTSVPKILEQSPSIGLNWVGIKPPSNDPAILELTKTNVSAGEYGRIAPALDDLRKLGEMDLKFNFAGAGFNSSRVEAG
jgi:hypothetical protein